MKNSEEKALRDELIEKASYIVYPKNMGYSTISDQMYDYNAENRRIWLAGAKWAEEQFSRSSGVTYNSEERALKRGWINIYKRDKNDPINDCGYVTGVRIFDTPEEAREYANTRPDGLALYKTIKILF